LPWPAGEAAQARENHTFSDQRRGANFYLHGEYCELRPCVEETHAVAVAGGRSALMVGGVVAINSALLATLAVVVYKSKRHARLWCLTSGCS
jgi:hypothetical protein